jgi:lysophospholipase L1-like esterase
MRISIRFMPSSPTRTPYRNAFALSMAQRWPIAWALLAIALAAGCDSPTAPGSTITYAALGASDAVGIGASPVTEGYVYRLARQLNGARHGGSLHNFGVLGALADQIAGAPLEQAIAVNPGVVTLWTGSNDVVSGVSPDAFAATLDRILVELRTRTSATVFVADLADLTQAPRFRTVPDTDVTPARVAAFNQRIAAVVASRGCVLVRLSTLPIDDSIFAIDGFHPNNEGYRRIADAFWAEMQRSAVRLANEALRH